MRLVTFQPDIPQNLGSMIRICACFGIPLDVVGPCGFPFSVKALRRSAMDYADIADVTHHDDWGSFQAQPRGRLVVLTTTGTESLWNFNFEVEDSLLMGRESAGVTSDVRDAADHVVYLPMPGGGRSMNVTVCAGIALSEAMRQCRLFTTP